MLQVFPQVNILKECQYKVEALPPYIYLFRRLMGLLYINILENRALKN